ncbi:MAG: transcription elongation factor GreA [Patescibacteria group bacterium]
MQQKEYLSKERHAELIKELDHLKTVRRKEIAQDLEYARSLGDLSENAEFSKAREDQAVIEDRISQLETVLANAEIVKVHHSSTVEVGTKVHLKKKGDTKSVVYTIVGSEEVDTEERKISLKSPIGSAVIGKTKGDEVEVKTPGGQLHFTITEIE